MNWVDAVLVVLLLASVIVGSKKGLIRELMAFAVFFAAFFAVFFLPRRPRTGAAASNSMHSSSVSDLGSRSFGTRAFFSLLVMYGP